MLHRTKMASPLHALLNKQRASISQNTEKYPCGTCGLVKPETLQSSYCNDCLQKEKEKKEEIADKYKDFLSRLPSREELSQTIRDIDECVLENLSVENLDEETRISYVYEGILEFIRRIKQTKDFFEIEHVLESKNWDDNTFTDTQPRDAIIEIIEGMLENDV